LARNLHDSITQSLFSLTLGLRAIRKQGQREPAAALAHLAQQETVAQQALTEMRALLGQLRNSEPAVDEPAMVDLVAGLQQLCDEQKRQSNLDVTLTAPVELHCRSALAAEIMAIGREALHNVVKHSGVQQAHCILAVDEEAVRLTIADHGDGFNLTNSFGKSQEVDTISTVAGHFGLRGMQERAAVIGGTLTVESTPGVGTVVTLSVPRTQRLL
jgi:signal transduction histidine kinase